MSYKFEYLGIGGILDTAIKLFKDQLGLLIGISFATLVPVQFVLGLITQTMGPPIDATGKPDFANAAPAAIIAFAFTILVVLLIAPLTNAATIFAVGSVYLSRPTTVADSIKQGLRRWGAVVWTSILYTLVVMLGLLLFVIPGIIFMFRYLLAPTVSVLEPCSGSEALSRSRVLMDGEKGKAFVMGLVVGAINAGIGFLANMITQPQANLVVSVLVQAVTAAFGACAFTVFYFSSRCKHDNFDLQMLAESVGPTDGAANR